MAKTPPAGAALADDLHRRRRPALLVSFSPDHSQSNYAQVARRGEGQALHAGSCAARSSPRVSAEIAGARVTAKQLETAGGVGIPVAVRIVGDDIATLAGNGRAR